ncbi:unnamed protein product [Closterium sp. Naga37s-1]|nr:unnamed protein product [Closterium sp. Naga37s-1]
MAPSPPGYYFRAGTGGGKNMWHIYLPGGAWCGTAAQCVARSKTLYGTSTLYPTDPEPNAGILSSNSSINPPFYNWNLVRLLYCDGGGYAGTAGRLDVGNGTSIYLDGWNITQAVIEDLKSKRGIKSAAQILLSGSSAGGQAVVALCDRIAAAFPWAATKCIADSGFFIGPSGRVHMAQRCEEYCCSAQAELACLPRWPPYAFSLFPPRALLNPYPFFTPPRLARD